MDEQPGHRVDYMIHLHELWVETQEKKQQRAVDDANRDANPGNAAANF